MQRTARAVSVAVLLAICVAHLSAQAQSGEPLHLVTPAGHTDRVNTVAYSASGRFLVSASNDWTARVWDAKSGRELLALRRPDGPVQGAWFVGDSIVVTLDGAPPVVHVWSIPDGVIRDTIRPPGLLAAAVRPSSGDSLIIATSDASGFIRIWNPRASRRPVDSLASPLTGPARALTWSPDGRTLYVFGLEQVATPIEFPFVRGGATGSQFRRSGTIALSLRTGWVSGAAAGSVSARHDTLAVATGGLVLLRRRVDDDLGMLYSDDPTALSVALAPVGGALAVGTKSGRIDVWDVATHTVSMTLGGATWVNRFVLSASGLLAANGMSDGRIRVWEPSTGRVRRTLIGHFGLVQSVAFRPASAGASGEETLLSAADDSTIRLWEVRTGRSRTLGQLDDGATDAEFSPDGSTVAAVGRDGLVRVWRLSDRRERSLRLGPPKVGTLRAVRFISADTLVVAQDDGQLWLVRVPTGDSALSAGDAAKFSSTRGTVRSMALSVDGNRFAIVRLDGSVQVWNRAGPTLVATVASPASRMGLGHAVAFLDRRGDSLVVAVGPIAYVSRVADARSAPIELAGHSADIYGIAVSPGGRAVLTASKDGSERVWRSRDFSLRLTHTGLESDDWVAIAPDGRFDGSEGALRRMHFANGLETIPLEGFFRRNITPGLTALVFADSASRSPDLRRGFRQPPHLTVSYAGKTADGDPPRVTVEGRTASDGWDVNLFQNGRLVATATDAVSCQPAAGSICVRFNVNPVPGINEFEALAISTQPDSTESERARVVHVDPATPRVSRLFILAVGVSSYGTLSDQNLDFAASNARQLAAALQLGGSPIFGEVKVDTLTDAHATRDSIRAHFRRIDARPEDVFVFVYSGHGTVDRQGNFYVLPHDATSFSDAEKLRRTAISARELDSLFGTVKALKRVMIIDACHSGAILNSVRGTRSGAALAGRHIETAADTSTLVPLAVTARQLAEERAVALLAHSAGIYTIAAADGEQVASEPKDLHHSVFTYTLLRALGDSSTDGPRLRSVGGIMSEIEREIGEVSRRYGAPPQYPQAWRSGQDFPLVVR